MHMPCWETIRALTSQGIHKLTHMPAVRVPAAQIGRKLSVGGWVKTGREAGAGAFAFLELNDGSCFESIQVRPLLPLGALVSLAVYCVASCLSTVKPPAIAGRLRFQLLQGGPPAHARGVQPASHCSVVHPTTCASTCLHVPCTSISHHTLCPFASALLPSHTPPLHFFCYSFAPQVMVTKEVAEKVGGLKNLVPTGGCLVVGAQGSIRFEPPWFRLLEASRAARLASCC